MEIVRMNRQEGKTTLIIERMKKNPKAVMVVCTFRHRDHVLNMCPELKGRVVSIHEFMDKNKMRGRGFEEAYIDEFEWCLRSVLSVPISLVTLDKEEKI